jgi:hypothetical protein
MWPLVVAAGISAAAAYQAQATKAKSEKERQKLLQQAADEIQKVTPPNPADQKVFYEQLQSQGVLTPELEKSLGDISSSYNDIQSDPRLRDAQMSALSKLQEVGETGLNFEDRAALQEIQDQNSNVERGQRQAILQNMAARGMGGSGAELASQLAGNQGAADRNARSSLNVAAQAQRRSLDAMMKSGELGGAIRGQDFNEASTKANALDSIRKFNMANSIGMQQRNVDQTNQTNATNMAEKQRIADAGVTARNNSKVSASNANQQAYDNAMNKAKAVADAKAGVGSSIAQQGADKAAMIGGIGNAVSSGVSAYGNQQANAQSRQADYDFMSSESDKNRSSQYDDPDYQEYLQNKYRNSGRQ